MSRVVSEASLTTKVKKFLDVLPKCWYFKVWGGGMQRRGIPDILGLVNGRFFALELKATDGTVSALQQRCVDMINKCGGYAEIVYPDDWDRVKADLEVM